ncbi:head fiber protein [Serratia rubidaea]|uniref:head fiber protein n=1 Tax=Serratia rubidaea TaxID=61652 RepID=UPI003FA35E00
MEIQRQKVIKNDGAIQVVEVFGGGEGGGVTVDQITDASAVGKSVLKAADAAAARTAIGAGAPYTLPTATTAAIGGVKQGAAVANAAGEAPTATEYNALLASLRAAGIIAS